MRQTLLQGIFFSTIIFTVGVHRKIYTALSLYLSSVKCRVLRELVLSNWVK